MSTHILQTSMRPAPLKLPSQAAAVDTSACSHPAEQLLEAPELMQHARDEYVNSAKAHHLKHHCCYPDVLLSFRNKTVVEKLAESLTYRL